MLTASTLRRLEAGPRRLQVSSVSSSMPAPASSTKDAAICVMANSRSRRFVAPVIRSLPCDSPKPRDVSTRAASARTPASPTRPARGQRPPTAGWNRVSGPAPAPKSGRRTATAPRPSARDQHAKDRAGAAEQQALGQQSPAQRPALAPSAARTASSDSRRTAAPESGSRRSTRDDEDQPGRREENQQNRACPRCDLIAQQDGVDRNPISAGYDSGYSFTMAACARATRCAPTRCRYRAPGGQKTPSSGVRGRSPSSPTGGAGW